jgi:hypothetical protein
MPLSQEKGSDVQLQSSAASATGPADRSEIIARSIHLLPTALLLKTDPIVGRLIVVLWLGVASLASAGEGAVLSPNAQAIAELIGCRPQLQQLDAMSAEVRKGVDGRELEVEIEHDVLAASLEVDAALAEIESEESRIAEVRDHLSGERDRKVAAATILSIVIGTGLGVVGTAMQFSDKTALYGDGVGVAAGTAALIVAIYAVRLQKGGKEPIGDVPNLLAPLIDDRKPHDRYPEVVWRYLETRAPDEKTNATRREALVREWENAGRIERHGDEKAQKKIRSLTHSATGEKIRIDVLSDRVAMLDDVHAAVSLMKRDLAQLVRAIHR